jgi:hypothetical protein
MGAGFRGEGRVLVRTQDLWHYGSEGWRHAGTRRRQPVVWCAGANDEPARAGLVPKSEVSLKDGTRFEGDDIAKACRVQRRLQITTSADCDRLARWRMVRGVKKDARWSWGHGLDGGLGQNRHADSQMGQYDGRQDCGDEEPAVAHCTHC